MHKYLSAAIVSMLALSVHAKGKWEIGVVGGWGMTKMKETLMQFDEISSSRYKFKLRGSGPLIGLTAGYIIKKEKNVYGISIGACQDFYSAQNQGPKDDLLGDIEISSKNKIKRKYTLELSGKAGRLINQDTHIYGKLGVLRSEFQEQYVDLPTDITRKVKSWGGTIGVGAQKMFPSINVGLEYNYQYYPRAGTSMFHNSLGVDLSTRTKFRPQYHNILINISKSF